ncbi:MAG: hypothetical protein AAF805_05620 [Planctomycetota bacterium]
MKTNRPPADPAPTLAKTLAPEDVRPGDDVAVLDREWEWPAHGCGYDPPIGGEPVLRVRLRPHDATPPLRVVAVCLPYVFVEPPRGEPRTLDVRAVRLARLDGGYARRVRKALKRRGGRKRRRR